MTKIASCHFCNLVKTFPSSRLVYECPELIAFLDLSPIRESHTLILTKEHYEYFDDLPTPINHKIADLGQRIARAQKLMYPVERAAFLYTGRDIAHVHAHVLPMFEKTDVTSLHYIKDKTVEFETPPSVDIETLEKVTSHLKHALESIYKR